jgi:hypothetical protein
MNIPIIFVHKGDNTYLDFSLNQAHYTNPENKIYLIANTISNKYDFVNYINLCDYHTQADEFAKVYQHMSSNSHAIELLCFQRWFIINEFCQKNNVNSFLYLDSDVLIYCNVNSKFANYTKYSFTISKEHGPQCCYFSDTKNLTVFCNYIMKLYIEPNLKERLDKKYKYHIDNNLTGGVCDMTAFSEYQKDNRNCAKDIATIENDEVFDDNFNVSDGFEMNALMKTKKIEIRDDIPYGFLNESKKPIKFNILHFQGPAKKYVHRYYTGRGLTGIIAKLKIDRFLMKFDFLTRAMRRLGYSFSK